MKVILVAVILCVGFSLILGRPDESEPSVDGVDGVDVESDTNEEAEQQIEESDEDTSSVKTKRGILHYGNDYLHGHAHGHGHLHTAVLPSATVPVGLHRTQLLTPYSRLPGIYRSVHSPTGHVSLTHGGASVQSYSVNYPRVPIVAARPVIPQHHHYHPHVVAASRPAILPVQPAPSVFYHQQRPIIPVAVSTSSIHQTHRVPYYVVRRPVAPLPIVPTAGIPHVHQVFSNHYPQIPHVHQVSASPGVIHQIPQANHYPQIPHVHQISSSPGIIHQIPQLNHYPQIPHVHQVSASPGVIHQIPQVNHYPQIPHVHQISASPGVIHQIPQVNHYPQIPHVHQVSASPGIIHQIPQVNHYPQIPHVHQHVPTPLQPIPTPLQPIHPQIPHIHPQFLPLPLPTIPTPEALPQQPTPGGWRPIIVTSPLQPTVPTLTTATNGNNPSIGLLPPFFPSEVPSAQPEVQPSGAGEAPVQIPQPQTPSTLYQYSPTEVNQLDNSNSANYEEYSSAAQELAQSHARYHLQNSHNYETASNHGSYSGPSSYEVQLGSRTRQY